eukprot:COSAG05_NODE_3723_length_1881_cov_3.555805_2_plen_159_part_00
MRVNLPQRLRRHLHRWDATAVALEILTPCDEGLMRQDVANGEAERLGLLEHLWGEGAAAGAFAVEEVHGSGGGHLIFHLETHRERERERERESDSDARDSYIFTSHHRHTQHARVHRHLVARLAVAADFEADAVRAGGAPRDPFHALVVANRALGVAM